jgi:polygalacturonase
VLIQDSTVTSGDDSICLKSGSAKGLHNVSVKNCTIKGSGVANGLKLGTATVGPIENVSFEDIAIASSQAAAIAVESVDGSPISNVAFRRITATNVGTPFFILLGTRRSDGLVGSIRGITFEDISASGLKYPWGSLISGSPADAAGTHPVADISFTNIKLTFRGKGTATGARYYGTAGVDAFPEYAQGYPDPKFLFATPTDKQEVVDYSLPAWGFFVRHAENVTFTDCANVTVAGTDDRKWLATKDATVTGSCGP